MSWEHPADRAALQALRTVPGVDDVIRKVLACWAASAASGCSSRATRSGSARRSSPGSGTCTPRSCTTFDWPNVPELYVSQTPFFNAGAYGIDEPFIVHPLRRDRAAGRRRAPRAALPRAGSRDERTLALPHHRRDSCADQPRCAADARGAGRAADPAGLPGVVAEVRALRRPRRACWARRMSSPRSAST